MDKLSNFVHEQIKSGVSSAEIKSHLLQNGWNEKEANAAINYATGKTLRNRIIIAAVGVVIIGILILSLVSLTKNPLPPTPTKPIPNNPVVLQPNNPTADGCAGKESSVEKDECYKQLLKTGYDCRKLTDEIELTYCNRAYEDIMLKGVDPVEEN
jgi:hypothetical protein